ncbi:MAG: hypothetical protein J5517_06560 [Eubacterium sp.]|nr:hypothetical protein [Eubacterium sp.]
MKLIMTEGDSTNGKFSVQISYMNRDFVWILGRGIFDKSMCLVDYSKAAEIKRFVEAQGMIIDEGGEQ